MALILLYKIKFLSGSKFKWEEKKKRKNDLNNYLTILSKIKKSFVSYFDWKALFLFVRFTGVQFIGFENPNGIFLLIACFSRFLINYQLFFFCYQLRVAATTPVGCRSKPTHFTLSCYWSKWLMNSVLSIVFLLTSMFLIFVTSSCFRWFGVTLFQLFSIQFTQWFGFI